MAEPDVVRIERRGQVQWLTINRPERRNAMNEAVIAGLSDGVRAAIADPDVRAIVITGAGDKAFCAGGDMQPGADGTPFELSPSDPRHFVVGFFKLLETCRLPVIARVNGHALAGGLGLACACDMAVAADDATFGTTETSIGLFPMMILPYLLRVGPRRKILEMCITGARFPAPEALELGLVNYVVPRTELDEKLDWLLARTVDKSPTAIRLGKMGYQAMQDMSLAEAGEYAQLMLRMMSQTEDAREGMAAFKERRPPNWTGR
jgi:enoyl-CoA hydratase/carnithine racemase